MGYCYTMSGKLCCDGCGCSGGALKRKCPYKVDGLPWCYPPALCAECYKKEGGLRGVHGDKCKHAAAKSQAESDAIKAKLAAGELQRATAWGDWHENVPTGMAGVRFVGSSSEVYVLLPRDQYNAHEFLSEYGDLPIAWDNPPVERSKRIA